MTTHGRVAGATQTQPTPGHRHAASRSAAIQAGRAVHRVSLDELRTLAILKRAATRTPGGSGRVPSLPRTP